MKFEEQVSVTFDDVLIKPQFSEIKSRRDVDLGTNLRGLKLRLPIFSANMDTITGVDMAKAMSAAGGMGVLHRFWSIEENVKAFKETNAAVSVGLGDLELERAKALMRAGAKYFFIDVAHGATLEVVRQLRAIKDLDDVWVCVGNFASDSSVAWFLDYCLIHKAKPDALKIGVGPGSACTTRIKTGVGVPQLSAIIQCVAESSGLPVIADGGLKTPGDIAKALGAGAAAVMIGGMLAGTDETPGYVLDFKTMSYADVAHRTSFPKECVKKYRGSASKESYETQGKDTAWRTAEGEAFTVPYKGAAHDVLRDIEGGLRSSFSYVGAHNLQAFQEKVIFVKVSSASIKENGAHGKSF